MYRIKGTLALLLLFTTYLLHCQEISVDSSYVNKDIFSQLQDDSFGGEIDFYQNPSLHVLIDKSARLNEKNGIVGFRIQIYTVSGISSREKAYNVEARFNETYSEIVNCPVYVDYREPYYRVRIGDFRSKNEAYYAFQQIKEDFPTSYIVKSKINFPKLDLLSEE